MASYTANYNLRKDASTDNYDVAVVNQNLDEIDAQMHQNEVASTTPFTGASSSANGEKGIVPRPLAGDQDKFLCGNGTWKTVQGGGGGGSSVTITPTLSSGTKIADYSIDEVSGSLYAPSGGGGGSTFETVFAGSKSTSSWNSPLVFNEFDVTAYDIIRITAALDGDSYVWLLDTDIIPVKPANKLNILGEAYCDRDNTSFEMYVSSSHNLSVSKIEGLVEGTGSSMVHYSTTEHQVGTWIDGSDLYERTINITTGSFTATQDMDISNYIDSTEVVHESIGVFNYTYQGASYATPINGRETEIIYWNGAYKLRLNFGSGSLDSMDAYITIRYTKTGGNS